MKPTDFSYHLSNYLTRYLSGQRNLSTNTIKSYRDTFVILLEFMKECHQLKPEKVSIKKIDKPVVESFLQWLENTRNNSISTRNQRLAAIHAFFRYLQGENPDHLFHCQKVLSIPFKRNQKNTVGYLTEKSMKKILAMPDTTTVNGRRDLTLLSTLYDTGARVQEIVDLKVRDVRLESPAIVCLTGKGRKIRHVPIMKQTEALLRQYLQEQKLTTPDKLDYPLFFNHQRNVLTRQGVTYILNKYVSDVLPERVSPHMVRQYVECRNMGSYNHFLMYYRELSLNRSPYYLVQHNLFNHSIKSSSSSHFGKLLGKRFEYVDSKAIRFFSLSALAYTSKSKRICEIIFLAGILFMSFIQHSLNYKVGNQL